MSYCRKPNPFELFLKLLFIALVVWFLIVLMAGCSTKKKITETSATETIVRDTVHVVDKQTIRDTVIQIEADSSWFEALIECDSNNQAFIREISEMQDGKRIQTRVVFRDKILRIESHVNEDSIKLYWKEHYEKVFQKNVSELSTQTEKETVIVKTRWPWWLWVVVIGGGLGVVIYFALPFIKKFINPLA